MEREKKSILVVDDDRAILKSLKNVLQSEGYSVKTAETGREAIEMSKAQFFNLVLQDIKLPDMEGTELLTKMRRDMIKIMITGYPSLDNAVDSLNRGADAFIIKPVKIDELLGIMREKLKEQEESGQTIKTSSSSRAEDELEYEDRVLGVLSMTRRGLSILDVAREAGLSTTTTIKYLAILRMAGKVDFVEVGPSRLWRTI